MPLSLLRFAMFYGLVLLGFLSAASYSLVLLTCSKAYFFVARNLKPNLHKVHPQLQQTVSAVQHPTFSS